MRLRDKPKPVKAAVALGVVLFLVGVSLLALPIVSNVDTSRAVDLLAALDLSVGFLVAFYVNGIIQPNPRINRRAQYIAVAVTAPFYAASVAAPFL